MSYTKPPILPAWGESNTTSADMIQPTNGQIAAGWPLSSTPPSRQRFNWILNFCANAVRYFCSRGLVDYDASETYQIGARIIGDDGLTYRSLINGNLNNLPSTSPVEWERWGYTLAQINASQLTQVTQSPGDSTVKVATTAFVTAAISIVTGLITGLVNVGVGHAEIGSLKIKWGSAGGSNPQSVSFGTGPAFSTLFTVQLTTLDFGAGASRNVAYITSQGTSGFSAQTDSSSAAFNWFAIGS